MTPGLFYHVYNRANAYEKLFFNDDNCRFFLELTEKYLPEIGTLYAYALIPNHFHFLIKLHPEEHFGLNAGKRISQVFSNFFNSYTRSFNSYYRRRGTLFSQHFKHSVIDSMQYRISCVLYIHHNAVHHKLCEDFEQWPYSSHRWVFSFPEDPRSLELFSWFGSQDDYLKACRAYKPPPEGKIYFD